MKTHELKLKILYQTRSGEATLCALAIERALRAAYQSLELVSAEVNYDEAAAVDILS